MKFRVFDNAVKRMSYSDHYSISTNGKLFYGNADVSDSKDFVMFSSEVMDSEGNELYEGDIVELTYATWFAEENECESSVGVVKLQDGCFVIIIDDEDFTPSVNNTFTTRIIKIGNVYE